MRNGISTIEIAGDLTIDIAALDGTGVGESVDISIRPENIHLRTPAVAGKSATITNHVFLGNISEYYVTLPSGQVLRVQTHPLERFEVGAEVAIEIDAKQCSVFRLTPGEPKPVRS